MSNPPSSVPPVLPGATPGNRVPNRVPKPDASRPQAATLRLNTDDPDPLEIALEKPVVSLGRNESNDIVIANPWISEFHAEFRWNPDKAGWYVFDLDSHNGVTVGGSRVTRSRLDDRDEIVIGLLCCELRCKDGTEPPAASPSSQAEEPDPDDELSALERSKAFVLSEISALRKAKAAAATQAEGYENEARKSAEMLSDARSALAALNEDLSRIKNSIAQADTEREAAEVAAAAAKSQAAAIARESAELEKSKASARSLPQVRPDTEGDEIAALQTAWKLKRQSLETAQSALTHRLEEAQSKADRQAAELAESHLKIDAQSNELSSLRERANQSAKAASEEARHREEERAKTDEERAIARERIRSLEQEAASLNRDLSDRLVELTNARTSAERTESERARLASLAEELQLELKEHARQNSDEANAQKKQEADLEMAELAARQKARNDSLTQLAGKLEAAEQELAHLQRQCDTATERLEEQNRRLRRAPASPTTRSEEGVASEGSSTQQARSDQPSRNELRTSLKFQLAHQTEEGARLQSELTRIADQLWDLRCGSDDPDRRTAQLLVVRESELIEQLKQSRRITADLQFALASAEDASGAEEEIPQEAHAAAV